MKVVLVAQARMGSSRLPGKSMLDLAGEPLVGRILERLQRCESIDEVVLAVPSTVENDVLGVVAERWGATVVRGSENDVLSRFLDAIEVTSAEVVVRFPADNATPEPGEIDRIVAHHIDRGTRGFSTNLCSIFGSGYPDGIGAEVFDASLLIDAVHRNPTDAQREHVHLNFFDYTTEVAVDDSWCPVTTISCRPEIRCSGLRLDVNTQSEYEFMRRLYDQLYPVNSCFSIDDILTWIESSEPYEGKSE